MRFLNLYLRSRQVPTALAAAFGAAAAFWLVGVGSPEHARWTLAVLAIGFGVAVFGAGLGGADPDLERTAAFSWPPRRLGHILAVMGLVAVAVAATGMAPIEVVLRDAFGLAGLTALGAAILGKQLSWCFPLVWAGGSAVFPSMSEPALMQALTWPTQPPNSTIAVVTALIAGAGGLLAYVITGSRR
ncbi:hypothetical protein JOF56_008148 [Kibdelosporangium banguiense]|uniref:Uncharacterized protein n=1 Tax=Kibdelosporangium banguiense TaxID=1365924 RepID=A0ABS4TTR1_9PSEU|nr:hypothetical protein [Kibdelosporangium banguiense]MBP2327763.1 hypothetical protein [Kibdelosporangium banguiense]